VAVVLGLLWLFGGEVNDSTPDDVAAAGNDPGPGNDGADATGSGGGSTSSGQPSGHSGEPTSGPTDGDTASPEPSDGFTSPEPTDSFSSAPTDSSSPGPDSSATTAPPQLRAPVGIVNQTSVNGLAEYAQQRLEDGGWDVPAIGVFDGVVPETTVYYPEGMREAAQALAAQFPEIGRIQPTFEGLNPNRLVLVIVDDYVNEVGGP
jgi:hypothetical protein